MTLDEMRANKIWYMVAELDINEKFYGKLSKVLNMVSKEGCGNETLMLGIKKSGFKNAMGKNDMGERNGNVGIMWFRIGGTLFFHKNYHKLYHINHICISMAWNKMLFYTSNRRGVDIGLDNHLLTAKIQVNLVRDKREFMPQNGQNFDVKTLDKEDSRNKFISRM